jgi:hypothetical protein
MATVALSGIITPSNVVTATSTATLTNKTLTAPTIASANLTTALTLAGAAGTNGQVLTSAGSGLPSWTTIASGLAAATQAQTETATSNTVAVTPLSTNWHPGVAKAWIVAAGDGSSILASHNITSITDTGSGELTVTIGTDFSSTNYVVVATAGKANSSSTGQTVNYCGNGSGTLFAGVFILANMNIYNGSLGDPSVYYAACYGDQ